MATYSGAQIIGSDLTKKEMGRLRNEILKIYSSAEKSIAIELGKWYSRFLTDVEPENYYNIMLQSGRLNELQTQIQKLYVNQSNKAGTVIAESSKLAFNNNFYRQQFLNSFFAPTAGISLNFSLIPGELVDISVLGTFESWNILSNSVKSRIRQTFGQERLYFPKSGTLSRFLIENQQKEIRKLRQTIVQSLIEGDSFNKLSTKISKVIGVQTRKGGKVAVSGAKANALRIARTEGNRNLAASQFASDHWTSSEGANLKRKILATLDLRTRRQSQEMDGQTVEIDEPFTYPNGATSFYPGNSGVAEYDINDRESVISFMEGVPPELRRGRNPVTGENEVFSFKEFESWAKDNNLEQNKSGVWS